MAVILKKELGEILYHPTSTLDKLPSPRDLAGKVLLKGRRTSGKDDGLSETTKASVDINGRRVSLNQRSNRNSFKQCQPCTRACRDYNIQHSKVQGLLVSGRTASDRHGFGQ